MAELRFFSTQQDSLDFLKDVMDRGNLEAVPDEREYHRPEYRGHRTLTPELAHHVENNGTVLLLGPYSTHPLFFRQIEDFYYLGGGGPYISFQGGRVNQVDGLPTLVMGDLSYSQHYELERDTRWVKPSEELKAYYAELHKMLKQRLVRYRRSMWISPSALELFESGQDQIIAEGILQDLRKNGWRPPATPARTTIQSRPLAAAKVSRA